LGPQTYTIPRFRPLRGRVNPEYKMLTSWIEVPAGGTNRHHTLLNTGSAQGPLTVASSPPDGAAQWSAQSSPGWPLDPGVQPPAVSLAGAGAPARSLHERTVYVAPAATPLWTRAAAQSAAERTIPLPIEVISPPSARMPGLRPPR
jgi:hypothetical protein